MSIRASSRRPSREPGALPIANPPDQTTPSPLAARSRPGPFRGTVAALGHWALWPALYSASCVACVWAWTDNDPAATPSPNAILAAVLIGWGVYLIDRVKLRGGPEANDLTNQPGRVATLRTNPALVRTLAFSALLLATVLCGLIAWETVPYPLLAMLVVVGYGRPRGTRAKDVPLVKNLVVAGGLTGLAAGLSGVALRLGNPVPGALTEWAPLVLVLGLVTADAIVCDLDDMPGDRLAGTRTVPVLLGPLWAALFATGLAVVTSVGAWLIAPQPSPAQRVWLIAWPVSTAMLAAAGAVRARTGTQGVRVRNLTDARLALIAIGAVLVAGLG